MHSVKLVGGTNDGRVVEVRDGADHIEMEEKNDRSLCISDDAPGLRTYRTEVYRVETLMINNTAVRIGVILALNLGEAILKILAKY